MGSYRNMYKIPFYIGNFITWFVAKKRWREQVRGHINMILFKPWIKRLIKVAYGERVHSLKFVRQRTLKRAVFVVNGKYYVKIFRGVSRQKLCDFAELMHIVSDIVSVEVPYVIVDKKLPMYVCEKNSGADFHSFDKNVMLKHQKQIFTQMRKILEELHSIDVETIPDNTRFITDMQGRHKYEVPAHNRKRVLAHFDMNPSNFLFDSDINIVSIIDWDSIAIANNPDTDWNMFVKNWEIFEFKKHD